MQKPMLPSACVTTQVYATNSSQDHWLLGLQYVFKAYKDPVVTQVEMPSESLVAVAIASQVGGQLAAFFHHQLPVCQEH